MRNDTFEQQRGLGRLEELTAQAGTAPSFIQEELVDLDRETAVFEAEHVHGQQGADDGRSLDDHPAGAGPFIGKKRLQGARGVRRIEAGHLFERPVALDKRHQCRNVLDAGRADDGQGWCGQRPSPDPGRPADGAPWT